MQNHLKSMTRFFMGVYRPHPAKALLPQDNALCMVISLTSKTSLSRQVSIILAAASTTNPTTIRDINAALIEISDKVQRWIDKYGYDELRNMYGNPSESMSISNLVAKLECINDAEYKRHWDDRQHLHGLFGADKEVRKKL